MSGCDDERWSAIELATRFSTTRPAGGSITTPNRFDRITGVSSGGRQRFDSHNLHRTTAKATLTHYRAGFAEADLWNCVGAVFVSIGYAAVVMWIVKRGALPGLRRRLAAVGQMAFSNYLFHSVTASLLFLGWGFGLAGRFDYAAQLLIVVAIWIVQLIVSPIWLQSFRFGPAE